MITGVEVVWWSTTFEMASNVNSEQDAGNGSGCEKQLLWLSDDVLMMTLINLTLDERIGVERTSKRIKAVIDRILSLQKIFAINMKSIKRSRSPDERKSVLMKSWSPLQSRILCSKSRFFHDVLSSSGKSSSLSILSRCSSVKLVNLEGVDVCGKELATWCPFITHLVTDKWAKAADYVQELTKNKKDVLIESFEFFYESTGSGPDMSFLSKCSRLETLIWPFKSSNIPPDVLSKVKTLSLPFDHGRMEDLIKWSSKNVEQLIMSDVHVQMIADNFQNLLHLEADIEIEELNQLMKLRRIQSIKALDATLNQGNVATFEQFLSGHGAQLKYLRIKECKDDVINRAMMSLSTNCPKLICFEIKSGSLNGIKLNEIELETIKLLPKLEKITLDITGFTGSPQDVEKVKELLLRCKKSLRKVTLINTSTEDLFGLELRLRLNIPMELMSEIIRILMEHKRTGESNAHNGKSRSWIEMDREPWNGSDKLNEICYKLSFYY